jgi:hypothetical protein
MIELPYLARPPPSATSVDVRNLCCRGTSRLVSPPDGLIPSCRTKYTPKTALALHLHNNSVQREVTMKSSIPGICGLTTASAPPHP